METNTDHSEKQNEKNKRPDHKTTSLDRYFHDPQEKGKCLTQCTSIISVGQAGGDFITNAKWQFLLPAGTSVKSEKYPGNQAKEIILFSIG